MDFKRIVAVILVSALLAFSAFSTIASAAEENEYDCPVCHTKFKAITDSSSSRQGMRLDLKPLTGIAPWRVPQCPTCSYIVFKQEYAEEELDILNKYITSDEYKALVAGNTSYFLLAKIYETLLMDDYEIAETYLKASWQLDTDKVKVTPYLQAGLAKFEAFIAKAVPGDPRLIMSEMLSGELERRLGLFEKAQLRFKRLQATPLFKNDTNLADIIKYQLELIEAKDSAPRAIEAQ